MYEVIFKYKLHDSVTNMLLETGLPSFDTVLLNCRVIFDRYAGACVIMIWLLFFAS